MPRHTFELTTPPFSEKGTSGSLLDRKNIKGLSKDGFGHLRCVLGVLMTWLSSLGPFQGPTDPETVQGTSARSSGTLERAPRDGIFLRGNKGRGYDWAPREGTIGHPLVVFEGPADQG